MRLVAFALLIADASSLQLLGMRAAVPSLLATPQWPTRCSVHVMSEAADEVRAQKRAAAAAAAEAAAAEAAAAAEEAAAAEAAKAAEAEKPKEEPADDLLSSPAFLKQKLKVLEKELVKIKEDMEAAKAEVEEQKEAFGEKRERLNTDFENFKKRNAQSALDAQEQAQIKLLQELLPVVDNYDRARGIIQTEGPEQEAVAAQYEAVYATLEKALADMGVTKIATVGARLHPNPDPDPNPNPTLTLPSRSPSPEPHPNPHPDQVGTEFDYNTHMAIQASRAAPRPLPPPPSCPSPPSPPPLRASAAAASAVASHPRRASRAPDGAERRVRGGHRVRGDADRLQLRREARARRLRQGLRGPVGGRALGSHAQASYALASWRWVVAEALGTRRGPAGRLARRGVESLYDHTRFTAECAFPTGRAELRPCMIPCRTCGECSLLL